MSYRYNVVVEVAIETGKMDSGRQAARQTMKTFEQEQIASLRRVAKEEADLRKVQRDQDQALGAYHQQIATKRFNDRIADYNRQKQLYEQQGAAERQNFERTAQARIDVTRKMEKEISSLNAQIAKNDPFQSLGARQQNLGQASAQLKELEKHASAVKVVADSEKKLYDQIKSTDPFQALGARQQSLASASNAVNNYSNSLRAAANTEAAFINQIKSHDPFQSLGARQQTAAGAGQSLRVEEIRSNTAFEKTRNQNVLNFAQQQQSEGLANIDRILKGQSLQDADRKLESITQKSRAATKEVSQFGQAFRGAFIGAAAGIVFSTLVAAITKPIELMKDLAVQAIEVGARFEVTRNAIAVFAGGANEANRELAALDETARTTTGLRLESAEAGYRQLRALGFEAENSRRLIAGLGTQRLLSGADETAVQRVIVNFTQLASGSTRASMDIKEIIHSMPTLRKEFALAYGTLDPKKIGKIFSTDPDAAIEKLTKQLEKSKGATGGLDDAWGKLEDQIIQSERLFANPILDPLTNTVKSLTEYIKENESTWEKWGTTVGNVIEGFNAPDRPSSDPAPGLKGILGFIPPSGKPDKELDDALKKAYGLNNLNPFATLESEGERRKGLKSGLTKPTFDEFVQMRTGMTVDEIRAYDSKLDDEFRKNQDPLAPLPPTSKLVGLSQQYQSDASTFEQRLRVALEQKAKEQYDRLDREAADKLIKDQMAKERQRQSDLENAESYYKQVENIRETAFRVEEAANADNVEKVFEIRKDNFKKAMDETKEQYDQRIVLNEGNDKEIFKLEVEKNNKLRDLEADAAIAQIQFDREQFEKRRNNLLEFKDLQIREVENSFSRQIGVTQRALDQESIDINQGYNKIQDLTERHFNIISQLTIDQFALRLQQAGLNSQERINIEKELQLALEDLAEQTYQTSIELNDKRFDALSKRLTDENAIVRASLEARQTLFSSISNVFDGNLGFGEGVKPGSIRNAFGQKGSEDIFNNIQGVLAGQTSLYEAQNSILAKQHLIQNEGLQREISLQKDLVQLEQIRYLGAKRLEATNYQNLINQYSAATTRILNSDNPERENIANDYRAKQQQAQTNLETTSAEITRVEEANKENQIVITTEKTKQLDANLQNLNAQDKQLKINQDLEQSQLKQNSNIQYLVGLFDKINSGSKDNLIAQIANIDLLKERNSAVYEDRKTSIIFGNETLKNLYLQTAAITHITELRKDELDAVARLNNAQIDVSQQFVYSANRADANVAEFVASQRGITEVLSDARINLITTAYDGLDKVAESLAKNFGVASDAVKDLISGLLRLGLNWIFRKLTGGGNSGSGNGGGGGFSIPGLGNIGGGGGGGGNIFGGGGFSFPTTPGFNPGGGSGGGNWVDFLNQTAGGGYGGGTQTGDLITLPDGTLATQVNGSGGLLGQGGGLGGLLGGGAGGLGILGSLGAMAPLFGLGLGSKIGGKGAGGALGGLGGLALGGSLAAILAPGIFGGATLGGGLLGIGGTIAPAAGGSAALAGLGTFLLNPFTIAGAGALLAGLFIYNKNKARQRDEKTRNQAMLDAFASIDKLIDQVNNDKIDGQQALSQADEVRKNYLDSMGQLKDKKTRNIALKDVSRIDVKIEQLKAAVANQTSRKERQDLLVPTFADGGSVSRFASDNFRNNPLGYQVGPGHGRQDNMIGYFPAANEYAKFSNTEYIMDAATTRNIGIGQLELMRQTQGRYFNDMLSRKPMTRRAEGGPVASLGAPVSSGGSAQGEMSYNFTINLTLGASTFVEVIGEAINNNNGSSQLLNAMTAKLKNEGDSELLRVLFDQAKKQGLIKNT